MIIKSLRTGPNKNLAPIHQWNIPLETTSGLITEELSCFHEGDDYVEIRSQKSTGKEESIYTITLGYEDILKLLMYLLKVTDNRDEDWIADLFDKYKCELSEINSILNSSETF